MNSILIRDSLIAFILCLCVDGIFCLWTFPIVKSSCFLSNFFKVPLDAPSGFEFLCSPLCLFLYDCFAIFGGPKELQKCKNAKNIYYTFLHFCIK